MSTGPGAIQRHATPNPSEQVLNVRNMALESQVSWLIDQVQALQEALHVQANGQLVLRKNLHIAQGADITA